MDLKKEKEVSWYKFQSLPKESKEREEAFKDFLKISEAFDRARIKNNTYRLI
jgi:hypothetical protein